MAARAVDTLGVAGTGLTAERLICKRPSATVFREHMQDFEQSQQPWERPKCFPAGNHVRHLAVVIREGKPPGCSCQQLVDVPKLRLLQAQEPELLGLKKHHHSFASLSGPGR